MVTDSGSSGAAPSSFPAALQQIEAKLSAILSSSAGRNYTDAVRDQLNAWRIEASAAALAALHQRKSEDDVRLVQKLVAELATSVANDRPADEQLRHRARELTAQGWAGKAAATLLVPAWEADARIGLRDVPPALIPIFATYCFTVPALLTSVAETDGYARVFIAALQDLTAMAKANRASTAVSAALTVYRTNEMPEGLARSTRHAAAIRSLRSRLVAAVVRAPSQGGSSLALPRGDRALRVGIVAQSLPAAGPALSLLPMLERIAVGRIELMLAVQQPADSPVERQLASRGAKPLSVNGNFEQTVQTLRDASLDVALFLVDGTWLDNPIIAFSLQRIAPLQLLHDGTGLPSDAAQFDLFTATPDAVAMDTARTADRPLLLTDAGIFARSELRTSEVPTPWTKDTLGLNPTDFVYGVFAPQSRIAIEAIDFWAQVLAAAPGTRLALFSPPPASDFSTDLFCAFLSRELDGRGVDSKRVLVFSDVTLTTHEERVACTGAIDTVLDFAVGSDIATIFAALVSGCPVVTAAVGAAAGFLGVLGDSELVASSPKEAAAIATRLGNDSAARDGWRVRLNEVGSKLTAYFDSFRASEAFVTAIEAAFDERSASERDFHRGGVLRLAAPDQPSAVVSEAGMLTQLGAANDAERRLRSLLLCGDDIAKHRKLLAAALSRQGHHAEAADLLVTVVELEPTDPTNWFDLGLAARQAGKTAVAVQAFQQGVQIEPRRVESWRILAELADELGNDELKQEISAIIRQLGEPAEAGAAAAGPAVDLNLSF